MDLTNLRLTQPLPSSNSFHIFDKNNENRSLCGKYAMIRMNEDMCDKVTGKETWSKGQDCKACFKKAGLDVGYTEKELKKAEKQFFEET